MGMLSSSVSITRYLVKGKIKGDLITTIVGGLKKNTVMEIDTEPIQKTAGWASFSNPYLPDFESSSCIIGTYFVFSLRIDKKNIPAKIIKKHYTLEMAKKLNESQKEYLSTNEKKALKENVTNTLSLRVPATPNIYDVLWNYEGSLLWFFSNQKKANEELETLFSKSFNLTLIRLFPYTMADIAMNLTDKERDLLPTLSPTNFVG
ncbi:MAG: recombination-associated protein RdgC [Desulfobacterales bacterium]